MFMAKCKKSPIFFFFTTNTLVSALSGNLLYKGLDILIQTNNQGNLRKQLQLKDQKVDPDFPPPLSKKKNQNYYLLT